MTVCVQIVGTRMLFSDNKCVFPAYTIKMYFYQTFDGKTVLIIVSAFDCHTITLVPVHGSFYRSLVVVRRIAIDRDLNANYLDITLPAAGV